MNEAAFTAFAFLGATWLAVFVVRYVGAPARLYWGLHASLPPASSAPLHLGIDGKLAFEMELTDENGVAVEAGETFYVRVSNGGERTLRECQLFVSIGHQDYPVSKPFSLRPGEAKELPVIRVHPEHAPDRRAFIYLLNAQNQIRAGGAPALLLAPAAYVIKVLSQDAAPATALVRLGATSSLASREPRAWTLEEVKV